jgi:hypothetical protein
MAWDPTDFIAAGGLVAAVGITFGLAARITRNRAYRAAVGVALGAAFILVWANLAVGIIGSEDNPANLVFFGVLAAGIAGAIVARFRPLGMARAMVATAIAQTLAAVLALVVGAGFEGAIALLFAGLWLASAGLFQKAAQQR